MVPPLLSLTDHATPPFLVFVTVAVKRFAAPSGTADRDGETEIVAPVLRSLVLDSSVAAPAGLVLPVPGPHAMAASVTKRTAWIDLVRIQPPGRGRFAQIE